MSPKELANTLRVKLFADHGTDLSRAMDYSAQVLNTLGAEGLAARTALHVVLNTIANILDEMLDPADNPAVGAEPVQLQLDRNALDAIIDTRIASWASDNLQDEVDERVEHWIDHNFDAEEVIRDTLNGMDIRISIN